MLTVADVESLGFILNENSNIFHKGNITITGAQVVYGHSSEILIHCMDDLFFEGDVKDKQGLIKVLDEIG
jgi:hypothetical protein